MRAAPATATVLHFVDTAQLLRLVADAPLVDLDRGDRLITAGEPEPGLSVLVSGALEVVRDGRPIARLDTAGAIVGETSLLLGVPATADVVAAEPTVVRHVEDAATLFDRADFSRHVAEVLARRLQRVAGYLGDLQRQFESQSATLGLVPTVLADLLSTQRPDHEPGSEREPDSPY